MRAGNARTWAAWGGVWLIVAAIVVLPHLRAFTMLSRIDEFQHVDYLAKTQQLEHVNGGELVGELAMREQACRGIDYNSRLPPCDQKTLVPAEFPGRGFNHTYRDPPTYYVVTGALAAVVEAVPGVDSLVTAGRVIGVLWLASGLLATFLLARRLGAGQVAAGGATLLLAATPVVVGASATVTTDAPLLLVGAGLCLVAVNVAEGRTRWWWLAIAAAVALGFKSTALPVVGLVAIFFLLRGERDGARRSHPRAAAAAIAGAVGFTLAWSAYTGATSLPSAQDIPMGQFFHVDTIGLNEIFRSFETTLSPVVVPDRAPFLYNTTIDAAVQMLNILLIFGAASVAWFWPAASTVGRMAIATVVAMVAIGPGYVVLLFVSLDVSYIVPGRYGLVLLPAAAACLAVVASRRRAGEIGLVILGLLGTAALLTYTL